MKFLYKNNLPICFEPKLYVIALTNLLFTFFLLKILHFFSLKPHFKLLSLLLSFISFVSFSIFSQNHSFIPHFHVFSLIFSTPLICFLFFFLSDPSLVKRERTKFFYIFMKIPLLSLHGIIFFNILFDYYLKVLLKVEHVRRLLINFQLVLTVKSRVMLNIVKLVGS